jgi:hypothetical protein
MLMCGDLRLGAVLLIAAALGACNLENAPTPTPNPTSPAYTQAADLRTHLDLLLSEQVMVIAKETAAAVNHSDEYAAYTSLLAVNSADLNSVIAHAFGNTSGVQFAQAWNAQNGYLVDYAIGVVTHNDDKAKGAMNSLTATFTPQFSQLLTTISKLPTDPTAELISAQVTQDKAFIDDVFAGHFTAYFSDLDRAYLHASLLGDLLAEQIAVDFPDKYPGDSLNPSVDARVTLNVDLQQHSYLATLATDASLNHRDAETSAALTELSHDTDSLSAVVEDPRFALTWKLETVSVVDYALGSANARGMLSQTVPTQLAAVTKAKRSLLVHHEEAIIKVVDDQRTRAPTIADDDRAAATSMQPIADSVQ